MMKATCKIGILHTAALLFFSLVSVPIFATVTPAKAGNIY
jgi:hypothetical protein